VDAGWPRFRLIEGIDTIALGAATIALVRDKSTHTRVRTGGILFDSAVRDAFRSHTLAGSRGGELSTWLYLGGLIVPNVISGSGARRHQNPERCRADALINAQSLGLRRGDVNDGVAWPARRPFVGTPRRCPRDASGQVLLAIAPGSETYQSFYSGHAAATATMAGLTCVHHQHLPLYGGGSDGPRLVSTSRVAVAMRRARADGDHPRVRLSTGRIRGAAAVAAEGADGART